MSEKKVYRVTVRYQWWQYIWPREKKRRISNMIYTGIATSADVAMRSAMKLAKSAGLQRARVTNAEEIADEIDFGL